MYYGHSSCTLYNYVDLTRLILIILPQAIASLGEQCACDRVVDVGAGQGHLSRLLTFGYKFKVVTVEASGGHAPKAEKFDRCWAVGLVNFYDIFEEGRF